MGTRGYRAYRYKKWYFVHYNHYDSYPDGLGLKVLAEARPSNHGALRVELEAQLKKCEEEGYFPNGDELDFTVSRDAPQNDVMIEWVYVIDLDRNTFHIDGQPLFRLDNLPEKEMFLEAIDEDSYGRRAYSDECPAEFRYNWKVTAPMVDESVLARYRDLCGDDATVSISIMLTLSNHLSDSESLRVGLIEALIGQCMIRDNLSVAFKEFESFTAHDKIEEYHWSVACSVANIPFSTSTLHRKPIDTDHSQTEVVWVRRDTCVHITTHLDDEKNLQASVTRLVDGVMKHPAKDHVVFGVAFSIYHCVIVRIDRLAGGSITHTPALQFLPSFYATSPSTEGITALARLAHRPDPDIIQRYLTACPFLNLDEACTQDTQTNDDTSPTPQLSKNDLVNAACVVDLPTEIWQKIALLMDVDDLVDFGHVSRSCRSASITVMHLPHIGLYRLKKIISRRVYGAGFEATQDDDSVKVYIGATDRELEPKHGRLEMLYHPVAVPASRVREIRYEVYM